MGRKRGTSPGPEARQLPPRQTDIETTESKICRKKSKKP